MLITSHGHTDVGFVREKNEDSFIVDEGKGIYAVADGVGGLPYGSLASRLAVRFYGALMHGPESCSTLEEFSTRKNDDISSLSASIVYEFVILLSVTCQRSFSVFVN